MNPITKMCRKIKEITLLEVLLALSGGVFNLTMVREITLYDLAIMFSFVPINPFLCDRVCQRSYYVNRFLFLWMVTKGKRMDAFDK